MDRKLNRAFERFRQKGDVAALATVFDRSSRELAAVARHLTPDAASAEDIVQATYLTAIEKSAQFDGNLPVMPWLLGILGNHAAKARRRAARKPDPRRVAEPVAEDPHDVAERGELGGLVADRIRELPESYSSAVASYLLEGLPPREIGSRLGISAGAASQRLRRGLGLLRKSLPASAAYGVSPVSLDLAGMRGRLLSGLDRAAGGSSLGGATAATSTLGALMLIKHPATVATLLTLLGLGTWKLLPASLFEAPTTEEVVLNPSGPDLALLPEPAELGSEANGRRAASTSPEHQVEGEDGEPQPVDWLALINDADTPRQAGLVLERIAALPPDEGLQIMQSIYDGIRDWERRRGCAVIFQLADHVHTLDILHLGTRDPVMEVQSFVLRRLSDIALIDFQEDYSAYTAWRAQTRGMDLGEVYILSARAFLGRTQRSDRVALRQLLDRFDEPPVEDAERAGADLKGALRAHGAEQQLTHWLSIDERDVRRAAMRWAEALDLLPQMQQILAGWLEQGDTEQSVAALRFLDRTDPDEAFLRGRVLPIVQGRDGKDPQLVNAAIDLLGKKGNDWALPTLLDVLVEPGKDGPSAWFTVSRSLAEIGNPEVIPTMIATIQADNQYETVYGVGYFGLGRLTGVPYDESHDGAWWTNWWESNKSRFPDHVANMAIPFVDLGND